MHVFENSGSGMGSCTKENRVILHIMESGWMRVVLRNEGADSTGGKAMYKGQNVCELVERGV